MAVVAERTAHRSAEDANAALWAEFNRRRKEDRLHRQGMRRGSEARQILSEVQQERDQGLGASAASSFLGEPATPVGTSSSMLALQLAASPGQGSCIGTPSFRSAGALSPGRRNDSEVQRMLAEVQEERRAAAAMSLRVVASPARSTVADNDAADIWTAALRSQPLDASSCPAAVSSTSRVGTPQAQRRFSRGLSQPALRTARDGSSISSEQKADEIGLVAKSSVGVIGQERGSIRKSASAASLVGADRSTDAPQTSRRCASSSWDNRMACRTSFVPPRRKSLRSTEVELAWGPEPKCHQMRRRAAEAMQKHHVKHNRSWNDRIVAPKSFDEFVDQMPRLSPAALSRLAQARRELIGTAEADPKTVDAAALALKAVTEKFAEAFAHVSVAEPHETDAPPDAIKESQAESTTQQQPEPSLLKPTKACKDDGRSQDSAPAVVIDAASVRAKYLANLAATTAHL